MAIPYPEGECFFNLEGWKASAEYDPNKAEDFYSRMLVEYIYNVEADHASEACHSPSGYSHPRSIYNIVRGSNWKTDYGCWCLLPIQYGMSYDKPTRFLRHELCSEGNAFRDHEKGGSAESCFMPLPMPTAEERFAYIDMLTQIRAIYLPVSQTTSEEYPGMSYWVEMNFALNRTVNMWRPDYDHAISLDVTGALELLCLPRQLRDKDLYASKVIGIIETKAATAPLTGNYISHSADYDWTAMVKLNYGLDVQWVPTTQGTWITHFLFDILYLAIGFIPGVGPILALTFALGWTALFNQNDFFNQLCILCPGIDLTNEIRKSITDSSEETKTLMVPGWEDYMNSVDQTGQTASLSLSAPAPSAHAATRAAPKKSKIPFEKLYRSASFQYAESVLRASGRPRVGPPPSNDGAEVITSNPPTNPNAIYQPGA
ncbi:uncharacterized protein LY89DRAFT_735902 [Mollisia scopiformis]|uniref:Uncharacterized protein n=1 Tax=Mollisia scopiformis TaxID=149040 RepID=A0A194X3S1_MOLSC|nr:uncharacterized protein LY89DRAFT_735902 [Mollisia scopiformis]KUJ14838.1 hypothetical protein LY89DRAFT_735902 [Mollisia scopiformis]